MTLLEKINKANDAACDLIKIISDCDYNIDVPKKRKFRELEEAVHAIDKRHRYIQCDNVISKLQDEYATNPEDLDLGRVTRYIARVNLLVFSVAMWTGEHLQLALREYYRNIIPKSISYPPDEFDDLLDVYVGAASWAAYDQVSHIYAEENLLDGESGPNVWYLLQPFFPSDAQSLGLSDTDQGVGELLTKIKEEFDWIVSLEYQDDWETKVNELKKTIREKWERITYKTLAALLDMYPDPTTQTETHNEDEEQDRNDDEMKGNNMTEEVVNEEADQGEVIEEATNKVQQNDAEENDEDMFEEEDMDEQVRSVPHFKNIEMESEQDELEEDDDDDNNNIKNICTVRGSTQDDEDASVPTRNNADHNSSSTFKRNTPEDEPNRDAESPPIKRPRVIPATQTDNGSVLDYDSDELESVITSARQTSNRFISSFQSVSGVPERFQSTITAQYSTLDDEIATPDMNESQPENTDQDAHTSDIPPPSSPQNPLDENLPGENQASERQSNVDLVDENQPSEHPASERQPSINPADDRQSGVNPEDEYQSSENSTDEYQPSETPADQPNVNPADEHQLDENSPDEHRESEKLPHGLPHTINEGPAEGFSDYSDSDGDYQDALQSTEPELSHSVASAPVRPPRADLPFRGTAGQTATETETTTTTATATNTVQATSNNTISRQSNGNTRNRAPDRGYNPWTSEELEALENGIGAFGTRWVAIKERYKETLRARTNVQLKDKARNELKFRKLAGEPLGVYECLDRQVQFSGEQSTRRTNRRALIKRRREAGEVE